MAALTKAFQSGGADKKQFCAIGSIKSNIGHLDTAAGVAGLMKVALSLKNKKIVPSLNYSSPNPKIDFESSPFFVNTHLKNWEKNGTPRRAGVSSFGIGGTNAHAILEEAPEIIKKEVNSNGSLILLSAKSLNSLNALSQKYIDFLASTQESIADISYTSQVGRAPFYFRRTIVADTKADASNDLQAQLKSNMVSVFNENSKKEVVFLFPGQGAQYLNMAREIYEREAEFRKTLDYCFAKLEIKTGMDLKKIVFPEVETEELSNQINQTSITQTVLFSVEYALAKLLMSWGILPNGMIGHSLGEYVAACISGVISLDDALHLIAIRGKLIQELPKGDMLSIFLSEEEVKAMINSDLAIAAINAPGFCVVSGTTGDISEFEKELGNKNISCQKLHTSHAFHSSMMNPILDSFLEEVKKIKLSAPSIPYVSNVTGDWINSDEVTDPYYWVKHLRNTVRYADGVQKLLENNKNIFLEVGPGRILSTLTKQNTNSNENIIITSLPGPKEKTNNYKHLLSSLAKLWQSGISIDWAMFNKDKENYRVSLPTYAFMKNRYWIESGEGMSSSAQMHQELIEHTELAEPANAETDTAGMQTYHQRPNLSVEYAAPETDFETIVATIWQDLIGIDKIESMIIFLSWVGTHCLLRR